MTFSLRARVVYPIDRPAIEHGVVTIDGERIVSVGPRPLPEGGTVQDLGDVVLLPGLVNAHTHLEFSNLKQPLGRPGMRLPDWIQLVIAERGRRNSAPFVSHVTGSIECQKHGVTAVGDITTSEVPAFLESVDIRTVDITRFVEVIGFSRARAASILSATIERLDRLQAADGGAADCFGYGPPSGISPHAPYTVSPFLLAQLVELASIRSLPVAMHVAESAEELEFLQNGTGPFRDLLQLRSMWDETAVPRGSRPLDYLQTLSQAPRALVIHGNYLNAKELAFLGEHRDRMSLVFCPRTHAYFAHPPYPLAELLAANVRVALGTDSRASNPDLNLLSEMRQVAQTYAAISPHDILRMGTLDGAEALGRADRVGSLTPGKRANLIAVPISGTPQRNADEIASAILVDPAPVNHVWIGGLSSAKPARGAPSLNRGNSSGPAS